MAWVLQLAWPSQPSPPILAAAARAVPFYAADAVGALDRPAALWPAVCLLTQLLVAGQGGGDALLVQ